MTKCSDPTCAPNHADGKCPACRKNGWYNWPKPLAWAAGNSPAPWYNTFCVIVGLWGLTDTWLTFLSYLLIAEGFLWTIEHAGQWRDK